MATQTLAIGTEDLVGATVTSCYGNEMTLEKDGRSFFVDLEYEYWYNTCMCDGPCYCSHGDSSAYFVAREVVEVPDKKPRKKK